jgi:hypothetical protein
MTESQPATATSDNYRYIVTAPQSSSSATIWEYDDFGAAMNEAYSLIPTSTDAESGQGNP